MREQNHPSAIQIRNADYIIDMGRAVESRAAGLQAVIHEDPHESVMNATKQAHKNVI